MTTPETNGEQEPDADLPTETPKEQMAVITNEELEQLQRELTEYKDKYLRALAEMENARKRMIKERQETSQQAAADVVVEFLKPLDNMENALKFAEKMSKDVQHWASGFQMILAQFKDILADNGITPVASTGQPFDPHFHEAIETEETDSHKPGTVIEEFTRGYRMGDKTIRAARVKVAKKKESENNEESSKE